MGEKLYYILKIIKDSKEPVSGKDLLDKLIDYNIKMNIKTAYSYIKLINDFYYKIIGKKLIKAVRSKGYIINDDYFDDGQLQLLIDSVIFNNNLGNSSVNDLVSKLTILSSSSQIDRLNIEVNNDRQLNYDLLLNLTTIIKAINNHRNIAFKYISYDIKNNSLKEIYHTNGNYNDNEYIVSPQKLILRGANYYLLGYFDKRKDSLSVYRVDRMRVVRNHTGYYEDLSDQLDLKNEYDSNVNMYMGNEKIDLKIIFDVSILREVVNQFGESIEVSKNYDGRIVASINEVTLSDGLTGWIMMLQDKIEVVSPISLRDAIKDKLEVMLARYII